MGHRNFPLVAVEICCKEEIQSDNMNSIYGIRYGISLSRSYINRSVLCAITRKPPFVTSQNSNEKHFHVKPQFSKSNYDKYSRKFSKSFFGTVILASLVTLKEVNASEDKKSEKENKDVLLVLAEADKHLRQRKYGDAEKLLLKALHMSLPRENRSIIAYVQDQLANLYLRINKIPEAEKLFQNVAQNLVATGFAESDPAILEISLKLATIAAYNGDHARANTCYEFASDESRKNMKIMDENNVSPTSEPYRNQKALLGMVLDSYSRYLYSNLKFPEALKVTKEACDVSKELFGEDDNRTIVLYNARSLVEQSLENKKTALEWAQKCVALAEKNENKFVVAEMVTFWSNLACLYESNEDVKKSDEAFKKALQYARKSNDDNLERAVKHLISRTTKENNSEK